MLTGLTAFAGLLVLAPIPGSAQDAATTTPKRGRPEVEITFLANAGFLLKCDGQAILIDGFLRRPYGTYEALPADAFERMANGEAPFDGPTLGLVSHVHADHFQATAAERFLRGNDQARLMSSPQVIRELVKRAKRPETLQKRVVSVDLEPGAWRAFKEPSGNLEVFPLRHGGDGHGSIRNYGHLITIGGVRFLHVGDAEVSAEVFAPYQLASKSIDVAFLPYWFFMSDEGIKLVREQINPAQIIACHIPPAQRANVITRMRELAPQVRIFGEPMESSVIQGRRTKQANRQRPK